MSDVLIRREKRGTEGEGHVMMKAEVQVMSPQAKEC